MQQEAKQLVEYFNHQTIDALVTMTHQSLEVLHKRIATASHTYGEYNDDKKTSKQPLFSSNVLLSLPNVVMRPSLDDIQQVVNQGVQLMVGITKEVYLWGQTSTKKQVVVFSAAVMLTGLFVTKVTTIYFLYYTQDTEEWLGSSGNYSEDCIIIIAWYPSTKK